MSGQDREPCLPGNEQAGPVESLKRHNRFYGFEIVIAMEKHRSMLLCNGRDQTIGSRWSDATFSQACGNVPGLAPPSRLEGEANDRFEPVKELIRCLGFG